MPIDPNRLGEKFRDLASRVEGFAETVEKFVDENIVEKDKRTEHVKKVSDAFDSFLRDNVMKRTLQVPVRIKKLDNFKGELPKYESRLASGFDVRAQVDQPVVLEPGQRQLIATGLSFEIPEGYEIQSRPRSGLAIREGLSLVNTPGTIDADYRGEVKIILINLGQAPITINDQDRIAQLVLCPVVQAQFEEVQDLSDTDRGAGGFGSTGV